MSGEHGIGAALADHLDRAPARRDDRCRESAAREVRIRLADQELEARLVDLAGDPERAGERVLVEWCREHEIRTRIEDGEIVLGTDDDDQRSATCLTCAIQTSGCCRSSTPTRASICSACSSPPASRFTDADGPFTGFALAPDGAARRRREAVERRDRRVHAARGGRQDRRNLAQSR
jgi:hypothetical protein